MREKGSSFISSMEFGVHSQRSHLHQKARDKCLNHGQLWAKVWKAKPIGFFCINFDLEKYFTKTLFILITEFFGVLGNYCVFCVLGKGLTHIIPALALPKRQVDNKEGGVRCGSRA